MRGNKDLHFSFVLIASMLIHVLHTFERYCIHIVHVSVSYFDFKTFIFRVWF